MKIGIISGCPALRAALASWLLPTGIFTISISIASLDEYRPGAQPCPDVWLFHIAHAEELPVNIHRLRDLCPDVPILAVLNECQREVEAIKAGARGLISCDSPPELFLNALQALGRGEVWLSDKAAKEYIARSLARGMSGDARSSRISTREAEILALAGSGRRTAEIAKEVCLSVSTVNSHLRSAYKKLGVGNRVSAAFAYLQTLQEDAGNQPGIAHDRVREASITATTEQALVKNEGGNPILVRASRDRPRTGVRNKQTNKQTKQAIRGWLRAPTSRIEPRPSPRCLSCTCAQLHDQRAFRRSGSLFILVTFLRVNSFR